MVKYLRTQGKIYTIIDKYMFNSKDDLLGEGAFGKVF